MEPILIRVGTVYDGKGVADLKQDIASAAHAPGASVPAGSPSTQAYNAQMSQSAAAAMQGPDTRAAAAARIRASYAAEKAAKQAETDRLTEQAQDKLNDQLVKEEAKSQSVEAKAAVAAERKQKAQELRAGRAEQGRSFTEDRMQDSLNDRLVKDEEKRLREEEERKRGANDLQHRRTQAEGRVEVMELRGQGKDKEADTLERTLNIHSRALDIQKSLNLHRDEAVKLATREVDAQDALQKKSGVGGAGRVGHAAIGLAENATGGSPFGGVLSSLSAFGPAGAAIGTAAALTVGLAAGFARAAHQRRMIELDDAGEHKVMDRRLERAGSFEGSAGGSRAAAAAAKDDYIKRVSNRANMEEDAQFKWWSSDSWGEHLSGTHRNKIDADVLASGRDLEEEAKQKKIQKEKWEQEERPRLDAARMRSQGDMRGSRDKEYLADWWKQYNEAQVGGATEADAREGANLHTADQQRAENMKWGRLVNARSSAGDIARVSDLASGAIRGHSGGDGHAVVGALESLIRQNADHHDEGRNHATLRQLGPRSLRDRR